MCVRTCSCTRKNALAMKLAESIAKTQPVPASAMIAPEAAGPKMLRVAGDPEQRVRGLQVPRADRLRHETVRGRPEERRRGAEDRGREEEQRQRHVVSEEHGRGERLDRRAHGVAGEHHRTARESVGDDTTDEREDDPCQRERGEHAAERGRGAVDREDGERERNRNERVPHPGGHLAEPEQPELALPQRLDGSP
jgi:hypothetical protein